MGWEQHEWNESQYTMKRETRALLVRRLVAREMTGGHKKRKIFPVVNIRQRIIAVDKRYSGVFYGRLMLHC